MQIDYAQIRRKTGYTDILQALDAYKQDKEPNAAWFCLEIVKPMVNGLVSNYMSHVQRIGLGSLVTRDDLTQEAYSYLIKSLNNFEPPEYAINDPVACSRAWNRYANLVIKSPMRDRYASAINQVDIPSWALKIAKRVSHAIADIETEIFCSGGDKRMAARHDPRLVAERAQLPLSKVKRYLDHGFDMLPQQRFMQGLPADRVDEMPEHGRKQATYGENPELSLAPDESTLLSRALQVLDRQQQKVLSARFGLNGPAHTQKEAAEAFDLSVKQIRLIEAKALDKIREAIGDLEAV